MGESEKFLEDKEFCWCLDYEWEYCYLRRWDCGKRYSVQRTEHTNGSMFNNLRFDDDRRGRREWMVLN